MTQSDFTFFYPQFAGFTPALVLEGYIRQANSPVTLTGGWIYNRVAKKGVLVGGKNGSTPLVDTGQLRDDFDWEIREK